MCYLDRLKLLIVSIMVVVNTDIVLAKSNDTPEVVDDGKPFVIVTFDYIEELDWKNQAYVKFTKALMESLGYRVEYVFMPGLRGVKEVRLGRGDALLGRSKKTGESFKGFIVLDTPYAQYCTRAMVLKGADVNKYPKTVGYQAGSFYTENLIKTTWPKSSPITFSNFEQAAKMIKSQHLDVVMLPAIADSFMSSLGFIELEAIPDKKWIADLYFVLSDRHANLLPLIKEKTEELKADFPGLTCGQ